jgi:TolB-like protein
MTALRYLIVLLLAVCAFSQESITVEEDGPRPAAGTNPGLAQEQTKPNYAVMNLSNSASITKDEADIISDRLRVVLVQTGKATVLEREEMLVILKEQGMQQSGACSDAACLVQIGQLLGVQSIVSGSIGKLGSMYLLNLRVIDVQTGKIVTAVSRDVNGDIESLVDNLKGVAAEIVADPSGKSEAAVNATSPRTTIGKKQPALPITELNKNRSGIHLLGGTTWGEPRFYMADVQYKPYLHFPVDALHNSSITSAASAGYEDSADFSSGPLVCIDLAFLFRTGTFLNFEVGPSVQWQNMTHKYYSSVNQDKTTIEAMYGNAGCDFGISYVKRIYPLKINVVVYSDLGFTWWSSTLDSVDVYNKSLKASTVLGLNTADQSNFAWAFGQAIGGRLGGEYLITPHVGIGLDFLFRWTRAPFEFLSFFDDNKGRHIKYMLDYPGLENVTFKFDPHMFGFDVTVNYYY